MSVREGDKDNDALRDDDDNCRVLGSRGGVETGLDWEVRCWMALETFRRVLRKWKKHSTRHIWSSQGSSGVQET